MIFTTALVTGASSGIGYEISKILAAKGHNLVLVARRKDTLENLQRYLQREYKVQVTVFAGDLTQPEMIDTLYDTLEQKNIPVDILVNNAGAGLWGPFATADCDQTLRIVQLNVLALTHLTRRFVPDMMQRGLGKVLNIASVASFMPGPYMAVYNASKAYVLSFSEALREELRGTGISVTAVCPGPISSEFHQHAGSINVEALRRVPMMGSGQLARAAVRAMKKRKAVVIPGRLNHLLVWLVRFTPRVIVRRIGRLIMRPKT